ncbi:MAG: pinensin family lanthipeptide [Cyclobacteriaceae bacterium]
MKKHSLKDLKVESFVTKVSARVKGGAELSHESYCEQCPTEYVSCNPTCGIRVDKNGNPYC